MRPLGSRVGAGGGRSIDGAASGVAGVVPVAGAARRSSAPAADGAAAGRRRVVRGRIGARRMIAATCSAWRSSGLRSSSSKKRATGDGWATWVSSWAITSAGGAGVARWIVSPVVAAPLADARSARREATPVDTCTGRSPTIAVASGR